MVRLRLTQYSFIAKARNSPLFIEKEGEIALAIDAKFQGVTEVPFGGLINLVGAIENKCSCIHFWPMRSIGDILLNLLRIELFAPPLHTRFK